MIQKRIQKELKLIAEKHNKPYYVIEEIYLAQFRLTAETMGSLKFETIKLPSFGKFIASGNKVKNFKKHLLAKYNKYGLSRSDQSSSIQGDQ